MFKMYGFYNKTFKQLKTVKQLKNPIRKQLNVKRYTVNTDRQLVSMVV